MAEYEMHWKGNTYHFPMTDDRDKYVVCACAKNEDDYIVEWVEHYLNYGFDKILLADNNDDNTKLPTILKDYIDKGQVQLFDIHGFNTFQIDVYDMVLQSRNFKWCAFFDCDEFLELNIHAKIGDFLNTIKEDAVLVNWMMFGSNGEVYHKEGSVQDRFKLPVCPILYFKENMYIKSIVRQNHNFTRFWNSHHPFNNGHALYNLGGVSVVNYGSHVYALPEYRYIYLKHYYTKSFEEWINNKTQRGWPDCLPKSLMGAEKYFILDGKFQMDINKFTKSVFDGNEFFMNLYKDNKATFDNYKAFELRSTTQNFYALTEYLMSSMQLVTDHVFMISNQNVDKSQFAIFLEYAIATGNHVCFCKNQSEIEFAMAKYNCGNYYFIRDCQ